MVLIRNSDYLVQMKAAEFFLFFSVTSLIMVSCLPSNASMGEDKKFLSNASREEDKKFFSNASLEEEGKIIRRRRHLDGDFLQVTDDGYGVKLPFSPEAIFNGVFNVNNIMSHVTQNLCNAFFSLAMWTIVGITTKAFTDEPSFTFRLSDQGREKRSAEDKLDLITNFRVSDDGTSFTLPFNPPGIFNAVLKINNLLIHVGQNLVNNAAATIMWANIALFDIIFGDDDSKPFGFKGDDFKAVGDGINLATIYRGVFTRSNVLIHASQNIINYIASFLGWLILAVFIG